MMRGRHAVLLLGALLLWQPGAAGADVDLEKVQAKAQTLLGAKNHAAAAALFELVVSAAPVESPLCLDALRGLRRAYDAAWVGRKFVQAGERLLARVKAADVDDETCRKLARSVLRSLASYHYDHRQHLGAIKRYEQLRELSEGKEADRIETKLAELYQEAGYLAKAVAIWEKRLAEDKGNRSLQVRVAHLYFRLGKVNEGLALYGGRKSPSVVLRIAEQLFRARCLPEAEALARKIAPESPRAKFLLGKICFEQKKFDDAAKVFAECFEAEEEKSHKLYQIAESLARLHAVRGTLKQAIGAREKELDDLKAKDDIAGIAARRKLLVLVSELKKADGDLVGAFEALMTRKSLFVVKLVAPNRPRRDWRLEKAGRYAVRQLVQQGRQDEAEALLERVGKAGVQGLWMGCARYVILSNAGKHKEAAEQLAKLEEEVGEKESKIFSLADQLHNWRVYPVAVRLYKRIVEVKPDHSVYDANAHARLIRYCISKGRFKEAKAHCDALDASLTGRNMGLIGEEHFRRQEAYVRYRAAGDNAGAVVEMLSDPKPSRRMAAAHVLARYGSPEHVPKLKTLVASSPPKLRAALQDAITSIQARSAAPPPRIGPVSDEQLRAKLAKVGKILWIEKDPVQPQLRWAAIEKKFVLVVDVKTGHTVNFAEALEVLGYKQLSPSAIAFTKDIVWVGTDHGLLAFERWARSWNAYSIGLKHLDVPVKTLRFEGKELLVTVELSGRPVTFRFDPVAGKWKKG